MATAEAAKHNRTSSKRAFTRKKKELIKTIEEHDEPEIITTRFEECRSLWKSVQENHEAYINQLDESDEIMEEEESWLEEVQNAFLEVERLKIRYLKDEQLKVEQRRHEEEQRNYREEQIKKQEQEEKQKQIGRHKRDIEGTTFMQMVESIKELLNAEEKKELPLISVIKDARCDVKKQLEKCKNAHTLYLAMLDEETYASEMDWVGKYQGIYLQVCKLAGEIIQKCGIDHQEQNSAEFKQTTKLRLERMKMPTFDGDIRDYPRFKTDFKKQVAPEFTSSESTAYALRSCLGKVPYEIVKNIDDDVTKMWERLDEKYGKTSTLTDVIMNEIKKFKTIRDENDKRFFEFVDIIERGHRDLERMNVEYELSNTTVISIIEEKLPRVIRREWSRKVNEEDSNIEGSNKFKSLLKFLLKQKRILEYDSADVRLLHQSSSGQTHHLGRDSDKDEESEEETTTRVTSRCLIHTTNAHNTAKCRVYNSKTPKEKVDLLRTKRACWSCLKIGHRSVDCKSKKECNEEGCDKYHHSSLHEAHTQGVAFHANFTSTSDAEKYDKNLTSCLLQLMRVISGTQPGIGLNVLWDGGATISLITFAKAREMGLKGEPTRLSVVKVGGKKETISSYVYDVPLLDKEGKMVYFQVYGIDKISTEVHRKNLKNIKDLFTGLTNTDIIRPAGEIDMLIGFEYAGYHPVREQSSGHLLVLGNRFGRCIGGSHHLLEENTKKVIQHVSVLHVEKVSIKDFYETETMGVACKPKCGSCRCGKCPVGGKPYTLKEERELHMIETGLVHKKDHWEANYPWIRDPQELPDNRIAAMYMLKSTERRLLQNKEITQMYSEQITDMVKRGVARKLSANELSLYNGPVFYLNHHEVLKPGSASTPCRIVFNSSANFRGHVLNNYWAKGPDLMNNLLGILIRFRENKIALTGDIKKMYHAVKIPLIDQHTHRFLWRDMETHREPDTYVVTSVSFGDRPAGNIATMALRKTAEMGKASHPQAADTIILNTYVDDIVDSVASINEAKILSKNIDILLATGGFCVKGWNIAPNRSFDESHFPTDDNTQLENKEDKINTNMAFHTPPDFSSTHSQKVLGMHWSSENDSFHFTVRLNFSPRKRKIRTEPDLTQEEVPTRLPTMLSKRMVLSQVNGFYDPMGLATPFTMQAKIMMRRLWTGEEKALAWDDDIPPHLKTEWFTFFQELFEMQKISFSRCMKPEDATGEPVLVIFSDASQEAFGTCAYARWQTSGGRFESRLIAAKGRIAPVKKISIVRLELCGAVLASRLRNFIKEESRIEFKKEYFMVDSQIVKSMLQKESYGFNTFAAVRIGEIQSTTNIEDWFWIEGELNIADWTTRSKRPSDIDEDSRWQKGPEFLEKPVEEWPVQSTCNVNDLPEKSQIVANIQQEIQDEDSLAKRIGIERFSSYTRLLRVTARVLSLFQRNPHASLKNAVQTPDVESLKQAELFWVKEAQRGLSHSVEKGEFVKLNAYENDKGIIVVGGRTEKWNEMSYDKKCLPLLPKDHHFSVLYATHIHNLNHLGVITVVAKIRLNFWIVGISRIVRRIRHNCMLCKILNKEYVKQKMAQLPAERLKPSLPWQYTGLDFFGPFLVKGEVNKRTRGKAYGLIFDCLTCRAVYIDIAADYSTEGFLVTFRRFLSLRGCPEKLYSDCGSQLVAADKELRDAVKNLDQTRLYEFGANKGIKWKFTAPDGPWRNGCSEALIKSVKKAIKIAVGEQCLSFSELQTVCFEAANLVNERPIGVHPTNPEDGAYLSPNHLVLGRASSRVPAGPFKEPTNMKHRFRLVQQIIDSFWRRWTRDYFPSLLIRQKWHTNQRNVQVGDVVIVGDSNAIRGNWRLAKVTKTFPGDDNLVRKVELQYKNLSASEPTKQYRGKGYTTVERPVQRLIVIAASKDE